MVAWVPVALLAPLPAGASAPQDETDAAILRRGIVSMGGTARIARVMARARRGAPITVGVIGGSITSGALATSPERNFGSLVAQWWREAFPKSKVTFVNAGIGATGSNYGCLRAGRDLLSRNPDFVVAEYAVNDPNTREAAETLEGIVRQTLGMTHKPAMMLIFTMHNNGSNAQEWHGKVGAHYGLPMVSLRDAVWPEIQAGRMKWEDVEADLVHPNDRGHAIMAQLITQALERVKASPPKGRENPVPQPLFTDAFEHVTLAEARDLKPTANTGWTLDPEPGLDKGWRADRPGSVIEFEIEGRTLFLMDWHVRGPMGRASVRVDYAPARTMEAWFDQTWGGWRCTTEIARDLTPGKHRVRVEILADKHAESTGHEYRVLGIGAAGVGK
ncbi:MAG: SGNH/GDSL hydrolase family protein [Armatimonadetes bacterium]|nr:SGNH/GDSL hydrolase family protein [Armatimonadota bacterium]